MSSFNTQPVSHDGVPAVTSLEGGLAETLERTARQIRHAECFDQEQRAEIYAILQALKTDTEAHRLVAEFLAHRLGKEAGDV
jgi:hypothetical protein